MKHVIAALLLALFAVTAVHAIVWRTDKNGDDIVRIIKVIKSPLNGFPHTFEVVGAQKDTSNSDVDAVRFVFSTLWAPRHLITHYDHDENSNQLFSARWLLWKIVEYQNVDSSPEFDPTVDNKISDYPLWSRSWTDLTFSQTTIDGAEFVSLCTQLNDTQPRPDVKICVNIADRRVSTNRSDPDAIKWTFGLANYPYQGNNTRLALKVSFNSISVVRDIADSSEGNGNTQIDDSSEAALEVATETDSSRGLAVWVKQIDVRGPGCNPIGLVVRSVVFVGQVARDTDALPAGDPDLLTVDRVHKIVYFSFVTNCQPVGILWDPELGINAVGSGAECFAAPSLFLLMIFVLLQLFL